MKLLDEFKKLPKEMVFDMYMRLVYDFKDYNNISRVKMLNEIIDSYKQDEFLSNICTGREIRFLKKFYNKKLEVDDIKKYDWEINELNGKAIFSMVAYEVFEEQKENVKTAIKEYDKIQKDKFDSLFTTMIGIVKVNGEMLEKAFVSFVSSFFDIEEKNINNLMGAPIFHYYCGVGDTYIPSFDDYEDTVYYRDYIYMLDDLENAREEYGVGGMIEINLEMYQNIFYYDLDISKKKSKELYDIMQDPVKKAIFILPINDARVLNDYTGVEVLIEDEKMKKLIYEALSDNPCAAMNGCTPNKWYEIKEEKEDLKYKYSSVPQNNAHLCKRAADEYYKLYFALLEYTNNKHSIVPSLNKIYRQEGLNPKELSEIDKYLWEHRGIIDDFIKENIYNFNEEELEIINGFKNAVVGSFIIVKFDREYTEFLDDQNGILYMVKGVRADFDELIDDSDLPELVTTTLLPFKGQIIFNGFFSSMPLSMGNTLLKIVDDNYDKTIKYYHL